MEINECRDELSSTARFWEHVCLCEHNDSSDSPEEITYGIDAGRGLGLATVLASAITRDLVATKVSMSEGTSKERAETCATDHFKFLLSEACHIFLIVMNRKKIQLVFTETKKNNANMHIYTRGEVHCYWTQPEVGKQIFSMKEIDVEVKSFRVSVVS